MIPGHLVARVGGCESMFYDAEELALAKMWAINRRMKQLYREGYRRFRVVPMPRTGDDWKFMVMGWPN